MFLNKDGYNYNKLFPKFLNVGAFPETVKQATFMNTTFDTSTWSSTVNALKKGKYWVFEFTKVKLVKAT